MHIHIDEFTNVKLPTPVCSCLYSELFKLNSTVCFTYNCGRFYMCKFVHNCLLYIYACTNILHYLFIFSPGATCTAFIQAAYHTVADNFTKPSTCIFMYNAYVHMHVFKNLAQCIVYVHVHACRRIYACKIVYK